MDEASQGSVELLESTDMVGTHVDKLNPSLPAPYSIDIQRVGAPSPHQSLLSNDLMDNHLVVEDFSSHNLHYFDTETDHDILSHLPDPDRGIAIQLQQHQAEPQNLSAPGGADKVSAMVSAFIQTTSSEVPTTQQGLTSSTILSRYRRPPTTLHSGATDDVNTNQLLVTPDGQRITLSHLVAPDGQGQVTAQRLLPADGQLLTATEEAHVHALAHTHAHSHALAQAHLLSNEVALQDVSVSQAQPDHRQSTGTATASVSQRSVTVTGMNGHTRVQDAQRYAVEAPEVLDEESADHQLLVQDQLIQVTLDPETQQFGVVPMSGQRLLVQTPSGEWAENDEAKEDFSYEDLHVKHEEVDIIEGSDGDVPVDELNDSDEDGEGDMRSSRRSLPHKKRLSRKLRNPRKAATLPRSIHAKCYKCNKCGEQFGTQAAYAAHRATHTTSSKKTPTFSCELCGKIFPNQLKFFEHLKSHYEPRPGPGGNSNASSAETISVATETPNRTANLQNRTASRERNDVQVEAKDEFKRKEEKDEAKQQQRQSQRQKQQQQHLITHQPQDQSQPLQPSEHHHHHQRSHLPHEEMTLKVENVISMADKSDQIAFQNQFQLQQQQTRHQRHVPAVHQPQQTHRHRQTDHQPAESPHPRPHEGGDQMGSILPPVSTITGQITYNCNLCGKHFRKQKNFEVHMSVAHPKQEEIEEFSEPEDMMEGIRGVVEAGEDTGDEGDPLEALSNLGAMGQSGAQHAADNKGAWFREEELSATEADLQALQSAEQLAQMNQLCPDSTVPKPRMNQTIEENMRRELKMEVDPLDVLMDGTPGKGKKNAKRLACPQCGRVFNYRNSLVYHLRSHSGERPHQCEECGKSFFATGALKVHMRLHSGDKPYKCEFCGRNFRQWGDLKYHCTSLHSEEKQYQCEYCGKDFARKYSLIVHRRIHTGEKNYVCEFCNKTFRASSYLQNHRRIHTGEKPHPCEVCGKPFRVRSDMKRHLNTHKRERQRLSSRSDTKIESGDVEDVPADMSADGPDDSQHAQSVHTLTMQHTAHLADQDHGVVVKTDSDPMSAGMIPLTRAVPSDPQLTSTLELAGQQGQGALQYGGRDALESARDLSTPAGQGTVYVWPIYMT